MSFTMTSAVGSRNQMSPSNSSDTKKELGTNTTCAGQASRRECVACMVSVRGDWGPGLGAGRRGEVGGWDAVGASTA